MRREGEAMPRPYWERCRGRACPTRSGGEQIKRSRNQECLLSQIRGSPSKVQNSYAKRKRQSNPSGQAPVLVMQWKGGRTSAGSGSWATPESRGSRAVGGRIHSPRIESGGVLPEAGVELGHAGALSEAACARQSSTREPLAGGRGAGRRPCAGERFGGGIAGWPSNRSRARV